MAADLSSHRPCVLRWANGLHDEKPLSVPRDAHFQLQTCPLTAVDALGNTQPTPSPFPSCWGHSAQGGSGWEEPGAGAKAPSCPCSPALLSGIPVVRRLRVVLRWCVPLHRGLLFCAGPSPGDQHRCVLVPAHSGLLSVSFSGTQHVGEWDSGPSFPVPLTCCLWDHPLCHKPVPESERMQAILILNSWLTLQLLVTSAHHYTATVHTQSGFLVLAPLESQGQLPGIWLIFFFFLFGFFFF